MLLAEGAEVNIRSGIPPKSKYGQDFSFITALEAAVRKSGTVHTRIVQLLLDVGADVRAGGHGASAELLYIPIREGNYDKMAMLFDAGVDPDEHDRLILTLML